MYLENLCKFVYAIQKKRDGIATDIVQKIQMIQVPILFARLSPMIFYVLAIQKETT